MKKIFYLFTAIILSGLSAMAQTSVPNGNFEAWNTDTYQSPRSFVQSSNTEVFYKGGSTFNCVKINDAHTGTSALKLTTVALGNDMSVGYCVNGNPDGEPADWTGGVDINGTPTGISGFYKSNITGGDSGMIILNFRKDGNMIGFYAFKFQGVHNAYTPFSFNLSPALTVAPDKVIIGCISSDFMNNIAIEGSMLQLDDITFTGIANQPAELNGGFENWDDISVNTVASWFTDGNNQGGGVAQTNDAAKGNYAIELTTYLGDHNGNPMARGSQVSTGYWDCNNNGPCVPKGGNAFTNTMDTLTFYYKYTPMSNDSAQVSLNFIGGGMQVGGFQKNLGAASEYELVKIPVNLMNAPDSVIVQFQSSLWSDTSEVYAGSVLKIDEVKFASQQLSTGTRYFELNKPVTIFPNPSGNGVFTVSNVSANDVVRVFDVTGREQDITRKSNSASVSFTLSAEGFYFVNITSKGKTITEKIVVKK